MTVTEESSAVIYGDEKRVRRRAKSVTVVVIVAMIFVSMLFYRPLIHRLWPIKKAPSADKSASSDLTVKLALGKPNALSVEKVVIDQLGIKTAAATIANTPIQIKLPGTLGLDSTQLEQVRCRFDGEVVEIGRLPDGSRPLQYGDTVTVGELLAVIWSRELGEKKSELVDALSQQRLDTATRDRLAAIVNTGAIPERELREMERAVEADRVAVSRIRRTLQTWRVTPNEIAEIEAEANRLTGSTQEPPSEVAERWARVEIRAAINGTILEQNITVGDMVSPDDDLFKVANLSRFRVMASAYEEDLPRLDALSSEQRKWSVSIPADPKVAPIDGEIEQVGKIIDPAQHTALVMGWVPNLRGALRAGQFISAVVSIPPPGNEVSLPDSAVIEKGDESFVFVAEADATQQPSAVFVRRSVVVSRQLGQRVCVLIDPTANTRASDGRGAVREGIKPNETVVISGAVELQQSLMDLSAGKP